MFELGSGHKRSGWVVRTDRQHSPHTLRLVGTKTSDVDLPPAMKLQAIRNGLYSL